MFAVYIIVFICWKSVSHAAPSACENLLHPLEQLDFHHLEGSWALVAGSVSDPAHLESLKSRDSARIIFAGNNDTSKISFTRVFSSHDSCQYMHSNITLQGSGFTFEQLNVTVTALNTSCSDCVAMRFDKSKQVQRFYLFSRSREVGQTEMEEFKAQGACLNITAPFVMDPSKELCPEKISGNPEGQNA